MLRYRHTYLQLKTYFLTFSNILSYICITSRYHRTVAVYHLLSVTSKVTWRRFRHLRDNNPFEFNYSFLSLTPTQKVTWFVISMSPHPHKHTIPISHLISNPMADSHLSTPLVTWPLSRSKGYRTQARDVMNTELARAR